MSSPILRGGDLVVTEQGIRDSVRQVMLPLWNTWYFFTLYANSAEGGYQAHFRTDQTGVLDRYVLAKLHELVVETTDAMDRYDLFAACASVRSFLDALTNWYIRRSRDRFWGGTSDDSHDAFDTLYTSLHVLTRVAAPLLPLVAEEIFTGLTGGASVHLTDWPLASDLPADAALVDAMDRTRDVCSAASSVRKARNLRVRLPLAQLFVTGPGARALEPFADIIKDEVNVRGIGFSENVNAGAKYELKLVPAALGPRLGDGMQKVMGAFRKGDYDDLKLGVRPVVGGTELVEGEYELRLVPTDPDNSAVLKTGDWVVTLNTVLTPELEREGLARDLVRLVQQARKAAELQVSDRISLTVTASTSWLDALSAHNDYVTSETLATTLAVHLEEDQDLPRISVEKA
jgi:isoleucyl-tRNA synthetase